MRKIKLRYDHITYYFSADATNEMIFEWLYSNRYEIFSFNQIYLGVFTLDSDGADLIYIEADDYYEIVEIETIKPVF